MSGQGPPTAALLWSLSFNQMMKDGFEQMTCCNTGKLRGQENFAIFAKIGGFANIFCRENVVLYSSFQSVFKFFKSDIYKLSYSLPKLTPPSPRISKMCLHRYYWLSVCWHFEHMHGSSSRLSGPVRCSCPWMPSHIRHILANNSS